VSRSRRKDGPDVVIEFDEPWHIDEVAPDPTAVEPRAGFTVWARWRGGQIVGYAGPEDLEVVKRNFWDSCLVQYVTELRAFAQAVRN
jgi:hypothetical protein